MQQHVMLKSITLNNALEFIYPTYKHMERDPTEYNEIRQYLINLLNLCANVRDMYEVLPKPLLSILRINEDDVESDIYFNKEFIAFQQNTTTTYKKLERLLTIKLLTE